MDEIKKLVLERGSIIHDNARSIMREATDDSPQTYCFNGVLAYDSYSALVPDEESDDYRDFMIYVFDEDSGDYGEWHAETVENPLEWQTEADFLKKLANSKTIEESPLEYCGNCATNTKAKIQDEDEDNTCEIWECRTCGDRNEYTSTSLV